jgi:co-chaperonin GroES (HSP10)
MIYQAKKIKPTRDMVLVRRIDTGMTPGGIIIPFHPDKKESNLAKIVAVGPGVEGKPETKPLCKEGEYWLIARYIGVKFELDNATHILVKWADCQAKVEFEEEALKLLDESLTTGSEKSSN